MQEKVMLFRDYKDGTSIWKVACDCADSSHDATLWFRVETIGGHAHAELDFSLEFQASEHYDTGIRAFFKRIWWRIKTATKIMLNGHITVYRDISLTNGGIEALQLALSEGKEKCEKSVKK